MTGQALRNELLHLKYQLIESKETGESEQCLKDFTDDLISAISDALNELKGENSHGNGQIAS
jgi:hypothetical protein